MTLDEIRERVAELNEERQVLVSEMNDCRYWMHADAFETRIADIDAELHRLDCEWELQAHDE